MPYLNTVGSFNCVVEKPLSGWFGEQGDNQTPFLRLPLVVKDGDCAGQTVIHKCWLTEKAAQKTMERLEKVFGAASNLETLASETTTLEGLECNIQTEIESYNGKDILRVKWLNPLGKGSKVKPLDASRIKAIISKAKSAPVEDDPFR